MYSNNPKMLKKVCTKKLYDCKQEIKITHVSALTLKAKVHGS